MVVLTAAALRLFALGSQPGGLYPDEAAEGYDAHRLLHQPGFHPFFFQDDAGREALYGYLVAITFRVAGESVTTLRATSAVLGVLAVVVAYAWLRRRGRAEALGAAAWMAGSLWLVCVSRDGMRNILVPLVGGLALWAMAAWAQLPSRRRALTAGAMIALGLWTYQPLKLMPLLLLLWLGWIRGRDRPRWVAMRSGLGAVAVAYLVVGAPMLLTAVTQPGLYFGRAVGVSLAGQHSGAIALANHTLRTLGMFALTGDPNQRHNVDGLPLLAAPTAVLAALGAWRAWRIRRADPLASLLLLAVVVFLLPPLLGTADEAPHFLRAIGLAAPLAALVGMGCAEVARARVARVPHLLPVGLVALLLAACAAGTAHAYFNRPVSHRYDAYAFNLVQLVGELGTADTRVVLLDDYRSTDVRFIDAPGVERGRTVLADPARTRAQPNPVPGLRCSVFAISRGDIARAYGQALATGARPAARDTEGRPSVWVSAC